MPLTPSSPPARPPFLFPALLLGTLASLGYAQTPPNPAAGGGHLAGSLANDARDTLRNPDLPPQAAAVQASILLECAVKLDASDLRALHLLAQTAQAAGRADTQKDALRKIIAADSGDLVAQMHYIDLLATGSQNAEDRMGVYRGALEKTDLDAQVRSEIALRLARLAEGRGDANACRAYLGQSLTLNSVNIGALRDQVRLAAAEPASSVAFSHHVQALAALLLANPYQPDAWLEMSRICAAANVHDRAAEFLQTAVEQFQIDGTGVAGDDLLQTALEMAISGKRVEGYNVSAGLGQLPDAPLSTLLVAELLAQSGVPVASRPATGTQPAPDRPAEIRKRLADMAKQTDDPAALADAAGADLTVFAQPGAATAGWVDAYAKLVKPEDATLARLKGWLLYRQGKLAEAQTLLKDSDDPLAKVCLAKILIDQGQPAQAGTILQDLWNGNPTGLLALQVSLAANKAGLTLTDSASATTLRPLIARLTPALSGMHRQPLDVQLISLNYRKVAVGIGEAVPLQVRITNTTDRPLPVGVDGVIKSTVGLAAATRGAASTTVGLYALEDLQRVYRLEPRQMMEATLRVDQGKLADLLEQNSGTYAVNVTLISAPRVLSPTEFSVGVGGQAIAAGDFQRGGRAVNTPAGLQQLIQDVTAQGTGGGERQLTAIDIAAALLTKKYDPDLATALAGAAKSPDPLVRAAVLRAAPPAASDNLAQVLTGLSADGDPLVRLLWVRWQFKTAAAGGDNRTAASTALQKASETEKDPLVKDYLAAALSALKPPATQPGNP